MADLMHKIWYGGWSKFGHDAFREIAMSMDTTSAVWLAACAKELLHQGAGRKGSRCPNDGCGTLVAFHDFLNHKMACPHGPCNFPEPGCEFAAPPTGLLAHLAKSDSMEVHNFHYGVEHRYISQPLLAPGSWRVETVVSRDNGIVFAVRFDMLHYGLTVSVQCVRSTPCKFPRYMMELHLYKPSMMGGYLEEFAEYSLFFKLKRSPSPIAAKMTKDFWNFLVNKYDIFILDYSFCIHKMVDDRYNRLDSYDDLPFKFGINY